MIVTVTANPSVDRTIEIDELHRGEVLRARGGRLDPGGKGVNVSRALAAGGRSTVAVLPSGGSEGSQLASLLEPQGVAVVQVPIAGAVRSNVSVVEPDGTVTKINEVGPELRPAEVQALEQAVADLAGRATWVVCAGSLPRGVPASFYADMVTRLRPTGARIAVDTSGEPLAACIDAGPDLIKPNHEELAELIGRPLGTFGEVIEAAREVVARGPKALVISLGADGALLVTATTALHAQARVAQVRSTVGAGDATLAGFLAGGAEGREALTHAVAYGAAAVSLPGSVMPTPADLHPEAVRISDSPPLEHRLEGHRP
jgi:1-phosphofructokinase